MHNNIYVLDTERDVEILSDLCVSMSRDIELKNIECNVDVEIMMSYGLFPFETASFVTMNRLTMEDEQFNFWYYESNFTDGRRFEKANTWYYKTLEKHKANGIEKCISLPLLYLAPHLVYKSKRPKTEMDMFRSPKSITLKNITPTIVLDNELWNLIPVTRYAEGMSKGMYFDDENAGKYCGTFYYNEPESTTVLAYKTSRTYFNKTDAMIKLGKEFGIVTINEDSISDELFAHMKGVFPPDLMLTPLQYTKFYRNKKYIKLARKIKQIPFYAGHSLDLYAKEDELDQPLCVMGKEYGIDIIILTNMVGSNQIVTEVLDTRDRKESFRSLIYTRQ